MPDIALEQQIAEARKELKKQREKIARLTAEGHDVREERKELFSMIENLAFLIKLRSNAT
jgi:uncharacterized coiled-coil protein SlyX